MIVERSATGWSPELEVRCEKRLGELQLEVDWTAVPRMSAVVGPSGAGKSSLLNLIAGLLRPDSGRVRWAGRLLDDTKKRVHVPPHRRHLGYVFQDSRLFPHLTVRQNLRYSPRFGHGAIGFDEVVDALGLEPFLDRRPNSLSGGERQRVALGRSLLAQPDLLLLDEPVSALDLPIRLRFMGYLDRVQKKFELPILFVTHDPELVVHFAEDAALMSEGRIVSYGPPRAIFGELFQRLHQPKANLLEGVIREVSPAGGAEIEAAGLEIRVLDPGLPTGSEVWLRVMATDLILIRERPVGISARNVFPCVVTDVEPEADRICVRVEAGTQWLVDVMSATAGDIGIEPGTRLFLVAKATSVQVIPR